MPNILALSGSVRSKSFNTMLLGAVADAAPAGTHVEIGSIKDIPLYDGDVDAASGAPPAVRELKEKIAAADGLLLVTPEYNHSIPGVLENAIDWISRPAPTSPVSSVDVRPASSARRPGPAGRSWRMDDPLQSRVYTLDRRAASKFMYTYQFGS